MFSFIYAWINGYVNNREIDDLRRQRAYYDVTVMTIYKTDYTFQKFVEYLLTLGASNYIYICMIDFTFGLPAVLMTGFLEPMLQIWITLNPSMDTWAHIQ